MSGRVKIDATGWKKVREAMKKLDGSGVRVGVLGSRGGTEDHGDGVTTLEIAAFMELGTKTVPERSFIRRTLHERRDDLARTQMRLAGQIVEQKMSAEKALDVLGLWATTAIRRQITSGPGIPPPLAPATVAAKGSSRPLVDTGRLLGAIQWEVVRGGAGGQAAENLSSTVSGEIEGRPGSASSEFEAR